MTLDSQQGKEEAQSDESTPLGNSQCVSQSPPDDSQPPAAQPQLCAETQMGKLSPKGSKREPECYTYDSQATQQQQQLVPPLCKSRLKRPRAPCVLTKCEDEAVTQTQREGKLQWASASHSTVVSEEESADSDTRRSHSLVVDTQFSPPEKREIVPATKRRASFAQLIAAGVMRGCAEAARVKELSRCERRVVAELYGARPQQQGNGSLDAIASRHRDGWMCVCTLERRQRDMPQGMVSDAVNMLVDARLLELAEDVGNQQKVAAHIVTLLYRPQLEALCRLVPGIPDRAQKKHKLVEAIRTHLGFGSVHPKVVQSTIAGGAPGMRVARAVLKEAGPCVRLGKCLADALQRILDETQRDAR